MYLEFYGLSESPFNLTPDANFLYPSKVHREVLAHLLYGVNSRKGFIMVTGEVGSGKTTICRALLKKLGPNTDVALVLNSFLSEEELLKTVNEDLGISATGKTKKELIDELNDFLLQQRMKGRNVVLIIDEAQNLSFPVLEQIRMLSNLETEKEKLLQIVLVGQPELRRLIGSPRLRQLSQRITVRHHITPLTRDETIQYIYHRLKVAGASENIVFANGALNEIYRFSRGIPRMINVICDQALLSGYVANSMRIDRKMILAAETEMKGIGEQPRLGRGFLGGEFSLVHVGAWVGLVLALGLIGMSVYSVVTGKTLLHRGTAGFGSAYAGKTASSPSNIEARKEAPSKPGEAPVGVPAATQSPAEELPSLVRLAFLSGATSRVGEMLPASLGSNMVPLFAEEAALLSILPPRPTVRLEKKADPPPSMKAPDHKVLAYRSLVEPLCALLRLWNKPPAIIEAVRQRYNEVGGHLPSLAAVAEMGWLSCRADMEKLRKIDLPVIVEVIGDSEEQRGFVTLVGLSETWADVATAEGRKQVDIRVFTRIYGGNAIVLCDDAVVDPSPLRQGQGLNLSVRRFQDSMRKAGYFEGNPSGWFTPATTAAVMKFQRDCGLPASGEADGYTKLMLYVSQRSPDGPHLTP
jgi:general secretion pathway protein A